MEQSRAPVRSRRSGGRPPGPLRRRRPAGPAPELHVRDSEPGQDRINIVIGRAPDRGARLREGAKAVKSRIATLEVPQVRGTAEQVAVL
jgi:hypothetical protein